MDIAVVLVALLTIVVALTSALAYRRLVRASARIDQELQAVKAEAQRLESVLAADVERLRDHAQRLESQFEEAVKAVRQLGGLDEDEQSLWEWTDPAHSLNDIPGLHPEVELEIRDLVWTLKHGADLAATGGGRLRAVLLAGPPGVGKTTLADALAAEFGRQLCVVSMPLLPSRYVGGTSRRVKDIFKQALEHQPCVVVLQDLEGLGSRQSGEFVNAAEIGHQNALLQLAASIEALGDAEVLVVGTTTDADSLDPRLFRAGLFEHTIHLDLPTTEARRQILEYWVRKWQLNLRGVDLMALASDAGTATGTIGFSPADLRDVLRRAMLSSLRQGRGKRGFIRRGLLVTNDDILAAVPRIRARMLRSVRNEAGGTRRTLAHVVDDVGPPVTFTAVGGHELAKERLAIIVDSLRQPERYLAAGARVERGILLAGPPGVGKTLLARAVAGESKVPFLFSSGAEFDEIYRGVGAARVRDLFRIARRHGRCIVFLDEIDAIGSRRPVHPELGLGGSGETLAQLLVEIGGFQQGDEFVVIGATNRPDMLDPALLRPGRFGEPIELALPGDVERRAIIDIHLANGGLDLDKSLRDDLVSRTSGHSGADLEMVVNAARIHAVRNGHNEVTSSDMEAGLARLGPALPEDPQWG